MNNQEIKIHFLGTNGWFPTDTGQTTCHLIDAPEGYIILDAGTGIYKVKNLITEDKPIFLFLSHFHLDHVFGLHVLNSFSFPQGMTILTQDRSEDIFNHICNQPFTVGMEQLPFKCQIKELGQGLYDELPFKVEARQLVHISRCFGYRFEFSHKIITYTTDTGVCPGMRTLAKNTDLLIAECGLRPNETAPHWPHLNPTDSARVAKEEGAKKLALIHFDAVKYPNLEDRELAHTNAKTVFENVIATYDDLVITL